MTTNAIVVAHDATGRRFVASLSTGEAVLEYSPIGAGTLDLRHTFVPREHRGRGIASRLAAAALEHAEENGLQVVPTCPFVARYIEAHPRYRPLLAAL